MITGELKNKIDASQNTFCQPGNHEIPTILTDSH